MRVQSLGGNDEMKKSAQPLDAAKNPYHTKRNAFSDTKATRNSTLPALLKIAFQKYMEIAIWPMCGRQVQNMVEVRRSGTELVQIATTMNPA